MLSPVTSFCLPCYSNEVTPSKKTIPIALVIIVSLGTVVMGLGIGGQLPLYAVGIGLACITTVCLLAVAFYRCRSSPPPAPEQPLPIENPILAEDNLNIIFSFLSAKNLITFSAVCKQWHSVATNDTLWKNLWISKYAKDVLPSEITCYRDAIRPTPKLRLSFKKKNSPSRF